MIEDHALEIIYKGNNFRRAENNTIFIRQAVSAITNMFVTFMFASRSEFHTKTGHHETAELTTSWVVT